MITDNLFECCILDTETTGISNLDQVIELAYLVMPSLETLLEVNPIYAYPGIVAHNTRWKPSVPMSARAYDVHKISLKDLQDCPPSENLELPKMRYMVAHNAAFDHKMIGKPDVRTICTMKLAQILWKRPEVENHKLVTLIETLVEGGTSLTPESHSALSDCYLTWILLNEILLKLPRVTSWEELWKLQWSDGTPKTTKSRTIQVMPFGKHQGELFCDIPADYLRWLLKQDITPALETACKDALGINQ